MKRIWLVPWIAQQIRGNRVNSQGKQEKCPYKIVNQIIGRSRIEIRGDNDGGDQDQITKDSEDQTMGKNDGSASQSRLKQGKELRSKVDSKIE